MSEGMRTVMYTNNAKCLRINIKQHQHIKALPILNIPRMHSLAGTCPHEWSGDYLNHHDFTVSCCKILHEKHVIFIQQRLTKKFITIRHQSIATNFRKSNG